MIGPVYATRYHPEDVTDLMKWLDDNLTQGIDYNWHLNQNTRVWELFFYRSKEDATAFKLKFGI